jgi:hypothetical protein
MPHRGPAQIHAGADLGCLQAFQRVQDDLRPSHEAGTQGARSRHLA